LPSGSRQAANLPSETFSRPMRGPMLAETGPSASEQLYGKS
jgi:hypothetical protein